MDIANIEKELHDRLFNLPFSANDIYLEDDNKQIVAVCQNHEAAIYLSNCVNVHGKQNQENELARLLIGKMLCSKQELLDAVTLKKLIECIKENHPNAITLESDKVSKTKSVMNLIKESYYLSIAIDAAKIAVTDVRTAILQKQFQNFYDALNVVMVENDINFEVKNAKQDNDNKENQEPENDAIECFDIIAYPGNSIVEQIEYYKNRIDGIKKDESLSQIPKEGQTFIQRIKNEVMNLFRKVTNINRMLRKMRS